MIFLFVVFWRKRKSSRQSNISDDVSKFFFIKIWWFMLKKRYISALLVLAYHVLSYLSRVTSMCFFCVACIMFIEFTFFFYCSYKKILFEGWGSYSPVLFSQYLFDLKFYWITCHHNKAEKLPKCNVKCKGVYLKGTNFRWFNQQVFFSDHLRTKAYIKIFTFPDSQDYMFFNNQHLF